MARRSPLVKNFLDYLDIEKGLSRNTIASYALDLARLQTWTSQTNKSLRGLTERDIERWLGDLSRVNLNTSSIARALSTTRSFFQFLILDNHIEIDPTQGLVAPKKTRRLPRVLTTQEVRRLLQTSDGSTEETLRDRTLLELLYATGLRISEAISLTHRDLNLRSRILRCHGKGNKERQVLMSDQAIRWLEQYVSALHPRRQPRPDSFVFLNQDKPLTRQFTWALISHSATKAELNDVTPHTLRHSFATHLLENGASTFVVQALLGHHHIATTEIYTRVSTKHLRKSYDQHHPRARARLKFSGQQQTQATQA
jgi:integrase/recombinase XerD